MLQVMNASTLTIRLPQEQREALKRSAKALKKTASEYIGELLQRDLDSRRYGDTPMDFADATLVLLAEELGTDRILTLDERGFRTYRHGRNLAFAMVLQDA